MIGTDDILSRLQTQLDGGKIRKQDIAKALKITPSRITELFDGDRKLKLDEAQRLVEVFGLEDPSEMLNAVATIPVLRLLVRHVGQELGVDLADNDPLIDSLARDCAAFLRYVSDPKVRDSVQMAEGFFLALEAMAPTGPITGSSQ